MPRPQRHKIGDKVGELTLLREAPKGNDGSTNFVVACSCGSPEKVIRAGALSRTRSCGKCCQYKCLSIRVFGELTVQKIMPGKKGSQARAECLCSCGRTCTVAVSHLLNGHNKSCRKCYISEFPIGTTVGDWLVVGLTKNSRGDTCALCKCTRCGSDTQHVVALSSLRTGISSKCGDCRNSIGGSILSNLAKQYRVSVGANPDERMVPKSAIDRELFSRVAEETKARDSHTCQLCSTRGGTLHSHHVFRYVDFPDLLLEPRVVITLCNECHKEAHNNNWRGPLNPSIQFKLLERLAVVYGTTLMEIYSLCLVPQKKPA